MFKMFGGFEMFKMFLLFLFINSPRVRFAYPAPLFEKERGKSPSTRGLRGD